LLTGKSLGSHGFRYDGSACESNWRVSRTSASETRLRRVSMDRSDRCRANLMEDSLHGSLHAGVS
jgi:hypothetical protein